MMKYSGCIGCGLGQPAASTSLPSSSRPWPSRTATGHRVAQGGTARARHIARSGARGKARRPQLIGYGEVGEAMAYFSWCGISEESSARVFAVGIGTMLEKLGAVVDIDIWYDDESDWCIEIAIAPFLVVSPTTVTCPWVDTSSVIEGEDMLDAIGDGFIEAVRAVDDMNRELGVADSNHRIDMGSIEVETRGPQSRFSVTVYPPVGVGDPGEEPIGPVEPSKKVSGWFIVGGIAAGLVAVGTLIGTIIWVRKKR